MLKRIYPLAAVMFLVAMLAAACSAPAPATAAPANVPTFDSGPTAEPPSAANVPPPAANPGTSLAPTCQATTSCEALNAEQIQLDCIKKVPYTNVLIPSGTDYEVVDKSGNFTCIDSGVVVNGKKVITCHGTPLMGFDLKLTSASCGGGDTLVTGTGQCQEGYGYDSAQQCCAPTGAGGGATNVTVNLKGCPIPNDIRPTTP